jgi:short-subunit dehydrogenase
MKIKEEPCWASSLEHLPESGKRSRPGWPPTAGTCTSPPAGKTGCAPSPSALAAELTGTGVQVQACCPGLIDTEFHALAGRDLTATAFPVLRPDEVVSAALTALRLGEIICIPGLDDPSMIDTISQAQQDLLLTAVSSPLAKRYQPA